MRRNSFNKPDIPAVKPANDCHFRVNAYSAAIVFAENATSRVTGGKASAQRLKYRCGGGSSRPRLPRLMLRSVDRGSGATDRLC